MPSKNVVL